MPNSRCTKNATTALARLQKDVARRRSLFEGSSRHFVGIDLGTTNSTAAVFDADALQRGDLEAAIRLIPVRQETESGVVESPLLPSIVAEVAPGEWRVGLGAKEARRRSLVRGRNIFFSSKSEMGLGREPYYPLAATKTLDSPYKVAARVLHALKEAIEAEVGPEALDTLVLTVPASFQLAARKDTFRAAELAGLAVGERALLDEPNAALLDYLLTVRRAGDTTPDLGAPRAILVLDFGGGTCDVSIVRVQGDDAARRLTLANLAISRYERLGGDNIDGAIGEQVLLPELLKQSGMEPLDLTWSEKRDVVLPQLLPVAEALKLLVCRTRRDAVRASFGVEVPARAKGRSAGFLNCAFERPSLTLRQFETVIEPFLDSDMLFTRGTELNPVTSIFAPITDALDRARLEAGDIDAVLVAGGSSLIPEVRASLSAFFTGASVLEFPDRDHTLFAVARGAALHSFFLHGLDRPLLKPIAQETLGVLAQGRRFVPLIEAGTELPHPSNGASASYDGLKVPRDLIREVQIVVAADSVDKVLAVAHLRVAQVRSAGESIRMSYRLDANKILQVRASLASDPAARCEVVLENPLCSTRIESGRQQRILELEQEVAQATAGRAPKEEVAQQTAELAGLYYEDQRYERTIDWARSALAARGRPDPWILNLMAFAYDRLGSLERSARCYREAVAAEPGFAAGWFNLSINLGNRALREEALQAADKAIALRGTRGAYWGQRGLLLRQMGREPEAQDALLEASRLIDQEGLDDEFNRGWRAAVAQALGRATTAQMGAAAAPRPAAPLPYDPEKLPALRANLVRVK